MSEIKMTRTTCKRAEMPSGPCVMFWTFVDSEYVGVRLEPGDTIEFEFGGPHEEGYHYRSIAMRHEGEFITCADYTSSRDCDGPLQTWEEHEARVDKLDAREPIDDESPRGVEWERLSASQRDHFAEAAGY